MLRETRELRFFEESLETLMHKQNAVRDVMLDHTLFGQYSQAKKKLDDLQMVGVAIQAVQQTIQRFQQEAAQSFAKAEAAKEATPTPEAVDEAS